MHFSYTSDNMFIRYMLTITIYLQKKNKLKGVSMYVYKKIMSP